MSVEEHFEGCHPEHSEGDGNPPGYEPQETEPCWHCGTPTTRGACNCSDEYEYADYIPPGAAYHCPKCRRWWAHMKLNVTKITFGAEA